MNTTDPGETRAPDPMRQAIAVLDGIVAANIEAVANLQAILALFDEASPGTAGGGDGSAAVAPARLHTERLVTADSMEPGGWVRMPGSPRWRQIASIAVCRAGRTGCRRIDFDTYPQDRDGTFVHVLPYVTYEYQSAADFDADCDRERAA